MCASKAST
jgi:pimeloyl-ACP methyl ester carboxylesterase